MYIRTNNNRTNNNRTNNNRTNNNRTNNNRIVWKKFVWKDFVWKKVMDPRTDPYPPHFSSVFLSNYAASHFVCKHFVFIWICISKHLFFSNKVDLSQERSVVIQRKRLRWNQAAIILCWFYELIVKNLLKVSPPADSIKKCWESIRKCPKSLVYKKKCQKLIEYDKVCQKLKKCVKNEEECQNLKVIFIRVIFSFR